MQTLRTETLKVNVFLLFYIIKTIECLCVCHIALITERKHKWLSYTAEQKAKPSYEAEIYCT